MEIAPVAGIRVMSLFAPRRVEAEAPFVIDEPARADDEERSARHEGEERGFDEAPAPEADPEVEQLKLPLDCGLRIDVTA